MTEQLGKVLPLHRAKVTEGLSDEALVLACAGGDLSALSALFDRFQGPLFRFLSRSVGPRAAEIEDLVQQTFLEAQRSAARFRGTSSVRVWLFGIAANLVRHHIRGEVRRRNALRGIPLGGDRPADRPDAAAERQQLLLRLGDALAGLPHDQRVAFVMCDLEDLPGVEVARALGLREGTLWRRLHDARKALRTALGGTP